MERTSYCTYTLSVYVVMIFFFVWHLAHLNNWRAKNRFLSTILCSVNTRFSDKIWQTTGPAFCWYSDYSGVVFPDLSEVGRTGRQWCDWKCPWNHQDPPPKFAAVQPSKAPFQLILMDRCCERFRVPSHDNLRYYLTRKNGHIGMCSVVVSNFSLRWGLQERFAKAANVNPAPVQVTSPN